MFAYKCPICEAGENEIRCRIHKVASVKYLGFINGLYRYLIKFYCSCVCLSCKTEFPFCIGYRVSNPVRLQEEYMEQKLNSDLPTDWVTSR